MLLALAGPGRSRLVYHYLLRESGFGWSGTEIPKAVSTRVTGYDIQ